MTAAAMDEDRSADFRAQVTRALGRAPSAFSFQKLPGEASNRSYYRVVADGAPSMLMVMPEGASLASEEVTGGSAPTELPFLDVQRYLSKLGVRVPEILRWDPDAGIMVLEDLGDVTFEKALTEASREALYGQAVTLLAKLRASAERAPDEGCIAFQRAFDERLYAWEFDHFREFGLEAWSGKTLPAAERAELDALFATLSERLAAAPRGFTHRDYQSRNLMVKDGELVVIDFQDALLGPRQYDLVALLRDSYVELPFELVDRMLDLWLERFAAEGGEAPERGPFKAFFDLLTLQRKLKDAARFEYIHRVKGNPNFLPSIPASLRYVKAAFARTREVPEIARLEEICAAWVPELS